MSESAYLLERAWVDGQVRDDVLVEIDGSRITSVTLDGRSSHLAGVATHDQCRNPRSTGDPCTRLPGLTLPGFANTHSHAFHRALRGRTQHEQGTFWTWRRQMYEVAGRLDPDTYYALARATYAEMVATGHTSVGEFHYLHHQPGGTPYADPSAMGKALIAAAHDVGIRITLLDTLYLSSGLSHGRSAAPTAPQLRFSDGDAGAWQARVAALSQQSQQGDAIVGVAAHSVRAVPAAALDALVPYVDAGMPVHIHLSEQVKENDDCRTAYGVTPARLLADHGLLGPMTTAVHATHLTDEDVRLLGEAQAFASFCPTTERDLGDGIGPSRALHDAGARLTLGSDSHAVIDAFEEMRALELDERLATRARGHWTAAELLTAATADGHRSLGFPDAGAIAVGQRADLVTVALDSPRTAGTGRDEHAAVFAAGAADVVHVVADGRVVFDGDHDEVGHALATAIEGVWR